MPDIYFKMTHWGSRLCLAVLDASSLQWSELHLLPEQSEGTRSHLFKAGCFIRNQSILFRKEPTIWLLFQILQQTKEARPFLQWVFKGSQLLIRWPGRGPQRWRRWLGHPNCRCVPPVPEGKKTPKQYHRPTRVTAWDEILATSTHQQSDSGLLFTNEWKAQAVPKHENCCLFHGYEVVTT